jgi:hypothetical protein
LMDALKFPASGARLARHSTAAFAVAATALGTALAVRATARTCGRAAMKRRGYTGHRSLLGVNVGQLPSLHQVGSFFAKPLKKGRSRTQ